MKVTTAIVSVLPLVLAALAVACGGGDDAGRTGVPGVDAVVKAVLSGDEEALRGFVRYAPVACSANAGMGDEPCRPGEADGTLVDALPAAQCEGHYIRPDGIDKALGYLLAGKPKLYGVYQGSPVGISGDHTAVFSSVEGPDPGQVFGMELLIDDGAIVWINFGCGESPEQLAQHVEQQPSPTPTTTRAASSGVPQVDALVQAVLSGDQEAVNRSVRYTPVACTTGPVQLGGPPECLAGEPDGTVVDALRVASCEGHYARRDGIEQALDYLLAGRPKLYAVYSGSPSSWLPGNYTAVFSVEESGTGQVVGRALVIEDGAIASINFGCGEKPEVMARQFERPSSPTPASTPDSG